MSIHYAIEIICLKVTFYEILHKTNLANISQWMESI